MKMAVVCVISSCINIGICGSLLMQRPHPVAVAICITAIVAGTVAIIGTLASQLIDQWKGGEE
jgi:hypothetical protein